MRFTCAGKEYEFRGEYRDPVKGDLFLTNTGNILAGGGGCFGVRAIIYPVPVVHTLAGIRFEETGEFRVPKIDEFFLGEGEIVRLTVIAVMPAAKILRPYHVLGDTSDA